MFDATAALAEPRGLSPQPAERTAARLSGAILLTAMIASMIAEFVGLGPVVVSNDAGETARSLQAFAPMVRIAAVAGLVCFISDIALAASLYVVLRRVNRGVAVLAAALRTANAVVLVLSTVPLLAALRLVSGAPYLHDFTPEQLASLARLMFGVRADAMNLGWMLLGLGQAACACLWLKSRYIPRPLALGGIFASTLLAVVPLAIIALPPLREVVGLGYMAPMFLYEMALGVWLLAKGVRSSDA